MKRFFDLDGHRFRFIATLNTRVERSPGGRREHTLAVSLEGLRPYTASYTFTDDTAGDINAQAEYDCRRWAEADQRASATESTLAQMGFSY